MENPETKKAGKIANRLAEFKKWRGKKKLETQEAKLNKLIKNLAKKGEINQGFFDFVRDFINDSRKPKFWKIVLSRENLLPFHLYDISMVVNDETSKTRAQQRFLEETDIEKLYEAFEWTDDDYRKKIFEEICTRIKYKRIKKSRVWELLGEIIKNGQIPSEYREKALELLQYQDPPDSELKRLIDLPISKSDLVLADLQKKIEVFIRERGKKKKKNLNTTLFNEIQITIEKIAQLKMGQG